MLVQNPLTEYIYLHGYNGIENMHDYCERHGDAIIAMYQKANQDEPDLEMYIGAFKNKIRWASHYGIFLRFELEKHIRISNTEGGFDLKKVVSKRGRRLIDLKDFVKMYPGVPKFHTLMDLRGISILERTWKHMNIENVDFTDAAFNDCDFSGVKFINCDFTNVSFVNVKLEQCFFDEQCVFWKNDFKGATLNSDFRCEVIRPRIIEQSTKESLIEKLGLEGEYHTYTKFGRMNHWHVGETKFS